MYEKKVKRKKMKKKRVIYLFHWGKIKTSDCAGKAKEHRDGFICDRTGPMDVQSFEIGHQSNLSTVDHLNPKRVGINNDGATVED